MSDAILEGGVIWKDGAMWTSGEQQKRALETGSCEKREVREGCDGWDVLYFGFFGEFFPFLKLLMGLSITISDSHKMSI